MGRNPRRWGSVGALALALYFAAPCAPAEAKLGDTYLSIAHSPLTKGEAFFRFQGRRGARYIFGPAVRCKFGTGQFFVDTIDGMIVQETLILPMPRRPKDEKILKEVCTMFMGDLGLPKEINEEIMIAFIDGFENGKTVERPMGKDKEWNLNVYPSPALGHLLLVVGMKPEPKEGATPP